MPLTKKEKMQLINTSDGTIQLKKELEYYKKQVIDYKSQLKKEYRESAAIDKIIEAIYKKNVWIEPLKNIWDPNKKIKTDEEQLVLLLSDLHIGEYVSKTEMGGFNEYTTDIMKQRVDKLTKTILKLTYILRQSYPLNVLNIYGLGDMLSGTIQFENLKTDEENIVDALYTGSEILSESLLQLASHFKQVKFVGVVGNHGEIRENQKKKYKEKYVNWDYILYNNLKLMCNQEKNIEFIIPKSFFVLDKIFDFTFLIMHGDNINSYKSIPWYNIQRNNAEFIELFASKKIFVEYICLGHFHNTGSLEKVAGEVLLNGSLIGSNQFSLGKLTRASKPHQTLFGIHPKQGITFRYNINL